MYPTCDWSYMLHIRYYVIKSIKWLYCVYLKKLFLSQLVIRPVDSTVLKLAAKNWNPDVGGIRRCNEQVLKLRCTSIWLAFTLTRRISWHSKGQCKTKLPLFFFKYQAVKRIRGIINVAGSFLKIGTRWNEILFQAAVALLPKKLSLVKFEFETGWALDLIRT